MNSNKTYRKLRLFKNIVLMGMLPLELKGEETVQKKKKKDTLDLQTTMGRK